MHSQNQPWRIKTHYCYGNSNPALFQTKYWQCLYDTMITIFVNHHPLTCFLSNAQEPLSFTTWQWWPAVSPSARSVSRRSSRSRPSSFCRCAMSRRTRSALRMCGSCWAPAPFTSRGGPQVTRGISACALRKSFRITTPTTVFSGESGLNWSYLVLWNQTLAPKFHA